jgi:hypothetical protein
MKQCVDKERLRIDIPAFGGGVCAFFSSALRIHSGARHNHSGSCERGNFFALLCGLLRVEGKGIDFPRIAARRSQRMVITWDRRLH